MKTLEQILEYEKAHRHEDGDFGITECKRSIKWQIEFEKKYNKVELSLYTLLERYVRRANEDKFFNDAMILACWELINGKEN